MPNFVIFLQNKIGFEDLQQCEAAAAMEKGRKKVCPPLQLLCQIEVIKQLHTKAAALEADYIDQWCRELNATNQV